jgi:aspartate aminotransferase
VGVLISRNRELMSHCLKWSQMRLSSPTVDQMASAALYSFDESYFDDMRREYMARRDTLIRGLRKIPGVVCDVPQGAFYVMAALPVDDAEDFQRWLLTDFDDRGDTLMYAAGGPFYATPGKGRNEVRMAYVLEREKLERAMEVLARAIERYNAR